MTDDFPPSFNQYQPPQTPLDVFDESARDDRPHSGLGIASFLIATFSFVTILAIFVYAGYLAARDPDRVDEADPMTVVLGLTMVAAIGLTLLGMMLGAVSLFFAGRKRVFGVLGLVGNMLILLATCGLLALGMALGDG